MKTREELMSMSHEELVNYVMEREALLSIYKDDAAKLKKIVDGISFNLEMLSMYLTKN